MGAGIITGVELVFGLIFNWVLQAFGIYSRVPLNLWPTRLPFTLIWLASFYRFVCHSKRSADLSAPGIVCQHLPCLRPLLRVKGSSFGSPSGSVFLYDPHTTPAHPRRTRILRLFFT